MKNDSAQFEDFLREFEPKRPRVLKFEAEHPMGYWRRLLAAAVLLIACGVSSRLVWTAHSNEHQPPAHAIEADSTPTQRSIILWTRMALHDPERLDKEFSVPPRSVLPRFDRPHSTLRILAKE